MSNNKYPQWYNETQKTWVDVMEETCELYGDHEYIVFGQERITYNQFQDKVDSFARSLRNLGIMKGDVVAVWMPNCPEWIIVQFATYKVGAILLPLYSYYKKREVEYALNQSKAKVLIMKDSFIGKINALNILREICPEIDYQNREHFSSKNIPNLKIIISVEGGKLKSRYQYEELLKIGEKLLNINDEIDISPFDVMNIMYTSGTTGFPKGGMSMHRTNLATVYHWTKIAGVNEETIIIGQVPLFTNFGGLYVGPLAMLKGAKVILTEQFDAKKSLKLIEKEGVNYIPGSPSMFIMLMDHPDFKKRDLKSLKTGHVAGAPLAEETMDRIINEMGINNIMQAYGLSECGGVSTVTSANDPYKKRLNTVGKPIPSCDLKVVDPDSLEPVIGKPGEVWLHDVFPGSCVGKGYWKMKDKTNETITEDGWFRTGDIGILQSDGYLEFVGRLKEMFTVGGFNIYPAEIENFLQTHPSIKDVYVIGVPDKRLGEVPMAWVQLREGEQITEEEIISFVKENLSSQKVPRYINFFEEGELPMTGSGKIQKYKLQEKTVEQLKL